MGSARDRQSGWRGRVGRGRSAAALTVAVVLSGGGPAQEPTETECIEELQAALASVKRLEGFGRALGVLEHHADSQNGTLQYYRYLLLRELAERHPGRPFGAAGSGVVPGAMSLMERALEAAKREGRKEILVDARLALGEIALREWEVALAREALDVALELDVNAVYSANALVRLGYLAQHTGDLTEAREHYERAGSLPLGEDEGAQRAKAVLEGSLAGFHLNLGTTDVAAERAAIEASSLRKGEFRVLKRRLDFLTASGRYRAAIRTATEAIENPNPLWVPKHLEHLRLLRALPLAKQPETRAQARATLRAMWRSSVREFAAVARVRYALAALDDGDVAGAQEAMSVSFEVFGYPIRMSSLRARARLALLSDDPIPEALERELDAVIDQQLVEWDRIEPRAGGIGFLQNEKRRTILGLLLSVRVRRHGNGVERAFRDLMRFSDRGSFARRFGISPGSIANAHALVPVGGAALAWLPSADVTHVFVLRDRVIHHVLAPGDGEARQMVRRFRDMVRNPETPREALRFVGERLRRAVIPAAAWNLIRDRRGLLVLGVDNWGALPLEALPGHEKQFLGWSHAVCHVPSVAVGTWLRTRAEPLTLDTVAATWSVAPAAGIREAQGIQALDVPPELRRRILDSLAGGAETVTASLLSSADYHLVVAHGVYDGERERPAGVAVDDRVFWSEDVESGNVAPLVTLLVCEAGKGPLRLGEDGGSHLGAAFFAAGANTVLLSREDLELDSTLALAEAFHEELARDGGTTPAEALRRARIRIGSRREFASPADHALLRVTGLGFEVPTVPVSAGGRGWLLWFGLAGALAVAVGVGFAVRRSRR